MKKSAGQKTIILRVSAAAAAAAGTQDSQATKDAVATTVTPNLMQHQSLADFGRSNRVANPSCHGLLIQANKLLQSATP
jgi:hypothetical protein